MDGYTAAQLLDRTPHLSHHGIKGQRWGVRRYQNPDGTWTNAGKIRYGKGDSNHKYDIKQNDGVHHEKNKTGYDSKNDEEAKVQKIADYIGRQSANVYSAWRTVNSGIYFVKKTSLDLPLSKALMTAGAGSPAIAAVNALAVAGTLAAAVSTISRMAKTHDQFKNDRRR